MKVAFVFLAVLAAFIVYVSAQDKAKELPAKEYLTKFKNLRQLIYSAAQQGKGLSQKPLTWKNRDSCQPDEYLIVPQRLMDWFHVLKTMHEENSAGNTDQDSSKHVDEKTGCSTVFKWFFKEYDTNKDNVLDVDNELDDIVSIPTEHCLKPFFQNCDKNKDHKLTLEEVCGCFNSVVPPCFEEIRHYEKQPLKLGMMKPDCDEDGFYKSRQCHENYCWCVDRYNQKVEGTEARGLVDCPSNTDPNEPVFAGGEDDDQEEL